MNDVETMTPDQIRKEGFKALERQLGPDGMIRFLQQFDAGCGDYTKERHQMLGEGSVDELGKEIVHNRER